MALKPQCTKPNCRLTTSTVSIYASHVLTPALHPSETEERLMVRLLAFVLYADERLEFGRGLSTDDEPDLWRKSLTDEIEQWIDVGQA